MRLLAAIGILIFALNASAQEGNSEKEHRRSKEGKAPMSNPHQMGVPMGHNRIITHGDGHQMTHAVIGDHRPMISIHQDKMIVRAKVGYYPTGHIEHRWDHWHRDWGVYWRFADWPRITQVTCEAVNTGNNYLYPVTGYRADYANGWSNGVPNQVVEIAMDQCYQDSQAIGANPDNCTLIDWECRYLM